MKKTCIGQKIGRTNPLLVCILSIAFMIPSLGFSSIASTKQTKIGMFDLYQNNREQGIPNLITADFLLLSYSLLRATNTDSFEENILIPTFNQWIQALDKAVPSDKKPESLANKRISSVLMSLANGKETAEDKAVLQELSQIYSAEAIAPSPLLYRTIDYTQFKPVGRHTKSKETEQFFRTFRYASSVLFPLLESQATGISPENANLLFLQAQQLAMLIQQEAALNELHYQITNLLEKRFGQSDDLSWSLLESTPAERNDNVEQQRQELFKQISETQSTPKVLAEIVDINKLEPDRKVEDVVTGWRLLPVFASPISTAFQALIFDKTQKYQGSADLRPVTLGMVNGQKVKAFPRAMEILSLLGDSLATEQLQAEGDSAYESYQEAFQNARLALADATGLSQRYLLLVKAIKQTSHRSQSALGFWTLQRYLDQLYLKQSTTPAGKGFSIDAARPGARLESASPIYQQLAMLVALEQQLNPSANWQALADILTSIQQLQWKIDLDVDFTRQDDVFLNNLDTQLLALTGVTDKPVAVAVHNNPNSNEKLWQATGFAIEITLNDTRGALLSHHEFKLPLDQVMNEDALVGKLKSMGNLRAKR